MDPGISLIVWEMALAMRLDGESCGRTSDLQDVGRIDAARCLTDEDPPVKNEHRLDLRHDDGLERRQRGGNSRSPNARGEW